MSTQDWDHIHRRYRLVNELAARPELLVEPLAARFVEEFGSREHALRALYQRWVTLVNGCLDVELEIHDDGDAGTALARATRRAIAHSPALAETLALFRSEPLVVELEQAFHTELARTIGADRAQASAAHALSTVRRIVTQAAAAELSPASVSRTWQPRNPLGWVRRQESIEVV